MRITNNMMINNTSANINGNKINVNTLNSQMSSQKKIQRPSDDPVIAIRALRLRSSLSQINQYYEKNIPDAQTWLEVSETALKNMNKILTDIRTQCVNGTNSYLTADDRNTILNNLTALKTQIYDEGNADNAGRTVFTGFKTNSQLTFMSDEADTSYRISQNFTYADIEEYRYYSGSVEVPRTADEIQATDNICEIGESDYERIRMAYDGIGSVESLSYSYGTAKVTFDAASAVDNGDGSMTYSAVDQDGNAVTDANGNAITMTVYENENTWEDANADGIKTVGDNELVFIKESGDLILGKEISTQLKSDRVSFQVDYQKTGFDKGELRPEYYYNCTDVTDPANPIEYTRYDADGKKTYEDINYTVAVNQTLKVNMQADEIFDMSIYQDVVELTNAVEAAISAHDKVDKLTEMQKESQYSDYKDQIQKWLDAAQKEADYADDNLTKLYNAGIGKFDQYIEDLNVAYTELGARGDQLEMTEARISSQQLTVEQLKSSNEDKELSDIIIEYTAAYNAYQASLMAASKIEKQTLLDYI